MSNLTIAKVYNGNVQKKKKKSLLYWEWIRSMYLTQKKDGETPILISET